jgi:hypothetical protein
VAISFVADNEYAFTAASQSVSIPTGWTAGDLLVVAVWHGFSYRTWVNGWTTVFEDLTTTNGSAAIYTRTAATGDTSWTFNFSSSARGCIWIGCYTGGAVFRAGNSELLTPSTSMTGSLGTTATEGFALDIGCFRRDTVAMGVSAGTGTTRATISVTGTEMVVVERTVSAYTVNAAITWTAATNAPSGTATARVLQVNLSDGGVPSDTPTPYALATSDTANDAWVYKGRDSKTNDTVGVV